MEQEKQGNERLGGESGNQTVASAVLGTGVVEQVSAGDMWDAMHLDLVK